jgi:hypothetical protein
MPRGSENEIAATQVAIQAAARMIVDAVLDLLQVDQHSWSARPCGTCTTITALVGRDFGCVAFAKEKKR